MSLFIVFGKKWIQMFDAFFHMRTKDPDFRLLMLVLAATMPTAAIGLVFGDYFEGIFGSPKMSSIFLTMNGLILFLVAVHVSKRKSHVWAADSSTLEIKAITIFQALGIGVAQCAAFFPGISRFGITLGFTLILGVSLATATDFAFLLAFPLILGAAIYKLPELFTPELSAIRGPIIVGSIVSLFSTLIAIFLLKKWSRSGSLKPFAFYCAAFGILSFIRFWA
jgi:undecaprenyl-diphosphatase